MTALPGARGSGCGSALTSTDARSMSRAVNR